MTSLTYLLDVNVLIALLDENHEFHGTAFAWFQMDGKHDWATCPITENGVVRILCGTHYPNRLANPQNVLALLTEWKKAGHHQFYPDDISLDNSSIFDLNWAGHSKSVTDVYLLGLASSKGGKLATFDRRINAAAVVRGDEALHFIES